MALPTVAIIGRPNVGKSSLLNAIAGHRISIVEPTAGVTRDRISTIVECNEKFFELVDTGGYGIVDADELSEHIENQIAKAMATADLVLFMVDIRDGVTVLDKKIANMLRKQNLNVIGVANKADSAAMFPAAAEFQRLGLGEFICISATNNLNKTVLQEMVLERLQNLPCDEPNKPVMHIAIVGKRNAGKSTLVNAMAGANRVIVSEIPGTTRDAVDVRIEKDDKTIVVIDTAGIRKKNKIQGDIEFYSYVRATKSISRADVVLFLIDANEPISQVDKKLSRFIQEEYTTCILVINKWDLAKDKATTEEFEEYLDEMLPALKSVPIAFTTAKDGKNMQSVLDLCGELFKLSTSRVSTATLNKAFEIIRQEKAGAAKRNVVGWPRVYYATQITSNPVTILMFVNKLELFEQHYMKYVSNRLKELLGFEEIPLRLFTRRHSKDRKL